MAIDRKNSFHLLLSDDELCLLKLLAEREGLNASDYLRTMIRTMPSSNTQNLAQVMRLAASAGAADNVSRLLKAHSEAAKVTTADARGAKQAKKAR